MRDVRKIVELKQQERECEAIKRALMQKIERDSLLVFEQLTLNRDLRKEIQLYEEMTRHHEERHQLVVSELEHTKKQAKRRYWWLGGAGIVLLSFLILK